MRTFVGGLILMLLFLTMFRDPRGPLMSDLGHRLGTGRRNEGGFPVLNELLFVGASLTTDQDLHRTSSQQRPPAGLDECISSRNLSSSEELQS